MALRVGAATALVVAYVLYPAVQNNNLADFHPVTLARPAAGGVLLLRAVGLDRPLTPSAAWPRVLLGAELALLVGGFGVLLALSGRRRVGMVTARGGGGVGGAVPAGVVAGRRGRVVPRARRFRRLRQQRAERGRPLARPSDGDLRLELLARQNFELAVYLVLPLAFVPLVAFRYVAPTLPWLFLVAMANAPEASRRTWLVAGVVPFLLVATAFGLAKLGRPTIERISVPPRVVAALLAAGVVFFVSSSDSSPYAHPVGLGRRATRPTRPGSRRSTT